MRSDISLPMPKYQAGEKQAQFCQTVRERIASLPGILSAGAISTVPLGFERHSAPVVKEDSDRRPEG